jgi:hypothetical protein
MVLFCVSLILLRPKKKLRNILLMTGEALGGTKTWRRPMKA